MPYRLLSGRSPELVVLAGRLTEVSAPSGVRPAAALAISGVALVLVWWATSAVVAAGLALLSLPVVVAVSSRAAGVRVLPGFVCAATAAVFYGSGLLRWQLRDEGVDFYWIGRVPGWTVLLVVMLVVAVTTMFVAFERALLRSFDGRPVALSMGVLPHFCHVVFVLACAGAALLVIQLGGLAASVELLQTHDKSAIGIVGSSTGLSLWSVFALPAGITAGILAVSPECRARRMIWAAELATIAGIATVLFGSRLTVVLIGIGVGTFVFTQRGRHLQVRHVVLALVALTALTAFVYAGRNLNLADRDTAVEKSLSKLSYGLFDVGVAAWLARDEVSPQYRSGDRLMELAESALPSFGAGRGHLEDARLDVVTVRAIGPASSAYSTGLPPSLAVWLVVGFGIPLGLLMAAGFAYAAALVTRRLLSATSPLAMVALSMWSALLFNMYKGGDVVLDLTAEARRAVYLAAIYAMLVVLSRNQAQPRVGETMRWG